MNEEILKIIVPYFPAINTKRRFIDLKKIVNIGIEGVDIKEAFFSTMSEVITITIKANAATRAKLAAGYAKGVSLIRLYDKVIPNGVIKPEGYGPVVAILKRY